MIREKNIAISSHIMSQLAIVAKRDGLTCAENVAELWLSERLDTMPEIAELVRLRAAKRREADAQWLAGHSGMESAL